MYIPKINTKSKTITLSPRTTLKAAVKARNKYIDENFPIQKTDKRADSTIALALLLHYKSKEEAQKLLLAVITLKQVVDKYEKSKRTHS